ncbi:MAG: Tm-1-like ATP-binding domain-containing protein [Acidobacteria bacterium]|nr:Tm-1-like ATP-binding domain-containing protein [Acidobacteriota bacterium]
MYALDSPDGPFWNPVANEASFLAVKRCVRGDIPVIEMDANINDPAFADATTYSLLAEVIEARSYIGDYPSRLPSFVLDIPLTQLTPTGCGSSGTHGSFWMREKGLCRTTQAPHRGRRRRVPRRALSVCACATRKYWLAGQQPARHSKPGARRDHNL